MEETYDIKSYESVLHNIYPHEEDIFKEMRCFESVLLKYGVQVYRPWTLENCNQVFARDVGFVIDDKIIVSNIIPNREDEKEAYEVVYNQIAYNKIFNLPEKAHVEGSDVVLYNNIVFVAFTPAPVPADGGTYQPVCFFLSERNLSGEDIHPLGAEKT